MADYSQMLQLVADYYGAGSDQWLKVAGGKGATADELLTILKQTPGVNVITGQDGSYRGWTLVNTGSTNIGTNIGAATDSNIIGGTNSLVNTGNTLMPPEMTVDSSTGLITVKNAAKTSGGRWVTSGGVAPAIAVAATGLSLGATIDKLLYEAKPGFLTDEQLETLNPENWKQISNLVDEQWTEMGYPTVGKIGRAIFDTILGIDSTDNSTQMYIDEDAYAYAAWYLQQQGVFTPEVVIPDYVVGQEISFNGISPSSVIDVITQWYASDYIDYISGWNEYKNFKPPLQPLIDLIDNYSIDTHDYLSYTVGVYKKLSGEYVWRYSIYFIDNYVSPSVVNEYTNASYASNNYYFPAGNYTVRSYSYRNDYYENTNHFYRDTVRIDPYHANSLNPVSYPYSTPSPIISNYGSVDGTYMKGIGAQSNAIAPDLSTATDLESFKTLLRQQYPDVWTNSVTRDVLQPDGTLKTFTYVPVPTPNATDWMDTEPTGDGSQQSQKDTVVNPDMDDSIKDTISSSGSTGTTTPNPPDTGGGDSPTVIPPVGKASSLWSIYNPTLEQVNQFGSWLWSSDFVEQLKKLFSDPMQAIIGLHKVYSPVQTSGTGTIKCGYLDSNVPSKLVSEQYVTVDCGSVDLQEYFGNVFDYPPYTEVSIYLPFIGVRQLDPSDVMRSTISVKYHVDVLTGACLAEIIVQRDAAGGTLYTFSGDAAVRYPVSSGSYMGIVSGLIGVATSVVSGNLLPALGGVTRLHTNVERSGSFTGNAGAMGSKIPYLIISRPQTAMADNFETLSGYPSNTYTPLSACSGYTQVKFCHVENLTATDAEKQEIERLLKEGVIL